VSERRFAVVTGGGTGGHVLPALAVADALVDEGCDRASIQFIGSRRGQDAVLVGGAGFPLLLLPGRGLARRVTARNVARNIGALAGTAWAVVRAFVAIGRWRPRVVVSVGGYASFPAALGAVVLRRPLVLVNVDAAPGLVHRLFGRFAAASAVAFPGTALPRAVVTGTPVRREIAGLVRTPATREAAKRALGLPTDRRAVALVGGSLGARRLNDAGVGLLGRWSGRLDVSLYHVTGRRDFDLMAEKVAALGPLALHHQLVPFEEHMAHLYLAADLLVCRAGAVTMAELAVAGTPAVVVPLPGAPGNHQRENAQLLLDAGAAVLLDDEACDAERLGALVEGLLEGDTLLTMTDAARGIARPDAARAVAALVVQRAR
jgi:UDP-N-acetylglucosamine--N-acetylmuramyl-(pentapeptide) pyrophosphoryl-undecaprenol N-acetylglucosamine transferase